MSLTSVQKPPMRRAVHPSALIIFAVLAWSPADAGAQAARDIYVMGTLFHAWVLPAVAGGEDTALEAAVREVERQDLLLSTWDPTTPMSALNRARVGVVQRADPEIMTLLAEAERWAVRMERAFDPTVGALVDAWDLRGTGRHPAPAEVQAALARVGPPGIAIDTQTGAVLRHSPSAWIDTGGFGKGAALRAAADTLRAMGVLHAFLDLGGQVMVLVPDSAPAWPVTLAHPSRRSEPLITICLANVSAATSGNSERGMAVMGEKVGHLLDPRTGYPAPTWGTVTVVSSDPLVADILSTALYVMGPADGLAWGADLPDVGVLFLVEQRGEVQSFHNRAMKRWLTQPCGPSRVLDP